MSADFWAVLLGIGSAAIIGWRRNWAFGTLAADSIWVEVVHAHTDSHWQYAPWLIPAAAVLLLALKAGGRVHWSPLVAWGAVYTAWVVLVALVHHASGDLNYAAGVPVVMATGLWALPRVHQEAGGRPWHQLLMVLAGATALLSLAAGVAAVKFHQGFPVPVGSHTLLAWQWPFANKNTLGFLTAFGVPAAAILLVEGTERPRWLWWAAGILSVMGLALSYSRTGWIAAAVGVLVVAAVVFGRRGVLWVLGGAAAALGLVTAKTGLHRLLALFKHGLSGRTLLWRAALSVARSHWLFGVGPGQSPGAMAPYVPRAYVGLTPSNGPLETLVEVGIVGLLLWAAVVAAAIAAAWQRATSVRHFGLWLALLVAGLVEQLAESSFLGGISFEDYLFLAVVAVVLCWPPATPREAS